MSNIFLFNNGSPKISDVIVHPKSVVFLEFHQRSMNKSVDFTFWIKIAPTPHVVR
ncbi:unnamed protein product [Linum tenue]|uniref:Uncharacterized protein n=1 Tax=Linum tenue TaxID=586396 RepID=A0AAV0PYP8_9ROSI|nr:unnamed protein product [Linum tenue]